MTPAQFARLESLFHSSSGAAPEAQQALIQAALQEDPLVGRQLSDMLAARPTSATPAAGQTAAESPAADGAIDDPKIIRVGAYTIIRTIGQGGMGTVYEAEQDEPRRRVALKLLSVGASSRSVVRRFRRESSILARLQHPGIAQIFDAGIANVEFAERLRGGHALAPSSYFTMELVPGQNICAAADALRLDTAARLRVIAAVCDAVQHAHQQGIIHRDLKPANILIANPDTLQPKVLDFGIARIDDDAAATGVTEVGQIIGTLAYMSPEQVAGDSSRVDTRSDVYALGACLYELLAGQPAFETANRPITDVIRMIRECEVPRLGTKNPEFRGDIETIVAKAMDRERERRYSSAAELAADICRYLRDEPILARPNSTLYQLRKFARRNRTLVSSAAVVLLTLIAGLIVSTTLYFRAQELRVRAEAATDTAMLREREARQQAYLAGLSAAAAALQDNDVVSLRMHLERAPESLRGWEWRYFRNRLDDSDYVFAAAGKLMDWSAIRWRENPSRIDALLAGTKRGVQTFELARPPRAAFQPGDSRGTSQRSPDRRHEVAVYADRSLVSDLIPQPWTPPNLPGECIICYPSIAADGTVAYGLYRNGSLDSVEIRRSNGRTARIASPAARFSRILGSNAVAIYGGDGSMFWIWNPESGELRQYDVAAPVRALDVGRHGSLFCVGLEDGTLEVRAVEDGDRRAGGGGHEGAVTALAFCPDETTVASGGVDRTVRIWDTLTLKTQKVMLGHTEPVRMLDFSEDGTRLASGGDDCRIRVWSAGLARDRAVLRGHTSYVYPIAFSPRGEWLASASWDATLRIWPLDGGEPFVFTNDITSPYGLVWHPFRKLIVVYGLSRQNRFGCESFFFEQGAVRKSYGPDMIDLRPLGFLGDSTDLVVRWNSDRREAAVWNAETGQNWTQSLNAESLGSLRGPDRIGEYSVILDTAAESNPLFQVFNITHDTPAWSFEATLSRTFAAEPDHLGLRRIATIAKTNPRNIAIRDLRDGGVLAELRGHTDDVFALAWSPDGSRLATAGRDRSIRIWDTDSWSQLALLNGHASYVWSLAFSPDGSRLASGSGDGTVRIWNTEARSSDR